MAFSERSNLKDERQPLLREPIGHYGKGQGHGRDDGETGIGIIDEILAFESTRNQRLQWMLFLTVTFLSVLILLATLGVLLQLSQPHPVLAPSASSSTSSPLSKVQILNAPLMAAPGTVPSTSTSTAIPGLYVYINESLSS